MPHYLIKPQRNEDFYVYWSDISECPIVWGSRSELTKYERNGERPLTGERFDRADLHGTSIPGLIDYGGDDRVLILMQRGSIHTDQLRELTEAIEGHGVDSNAVEALLRPLG